MSDETTTLKLAAIRIDGDTQLRTETNQEIIDPYEELPDNIIKELEEKNVPFETITGIAEYARILKSDIKGSAAKALLIGEWMLGRADGNHPRIGDPPYTKEQLEKEGFSMWCLYPDDINAFIEIGKLDRSLSEIEFSKGKYLFDGTPEEILDNLAYDSIVSLANSYVAVVFRCCYSIWHYLTFGLTQDTKVKLAHGEITTLAEAYMYDAKVRKREWQKIYKS